MVGPIHFIEPRSYGPAGGREVLRQPFTASPRLPISSAMTRALNYAAPAAERPFSFRRLLLWLVYYAGWAGGWAVPGTIGVVAAYEWLRPRGIDDDLAFIAGPALGAAAGVLLAVLARRSRWPQVILIAAGAVAAVLFARFAYLTYTRPRPLMWAEFELFFHCVCLGAALCLLLSGTAGLLLNRRRGG
jgi:hypothetical protein